MYRKNFVCLSRRTFSPMYTIFNMVNSILNMNNIYKFQDRIFMRCRERTKGKTGRQTDKPKAQTFFNFVGKCWNPWNANENTFPVVLKHNPHYLRNLLNDPVHGTCFFTSVWNMFILLYLDQYKYANFINFKIFLQMAVMYRKTFVRACIENIYMI